MGHTLGHRNCSWIHLDTRGRHHSTGSRLDHSGLGARIFEEEVALCTRTDHLR